MARGGKTSRVTAGMLSAAMGMNAATAQDRFAAESGSDAPMTAGASSSDTESLSGAKSPIQNADMSYAARAREGGTEAERVRQSRMLETGEQFAGAPSMPTGETQEPGVQQPPGEETRARPEAAPMEETEQDLTAQQAQQAQDFAADGARFAADRQHRVTLAQAQGEEQNRLDTQSTEKRTAMVWRGVTTPAGLTSFTGVSYVVYFFASNIRLMKTLFGSKNYAYIPKATLPQMGVTTYSNCMACIMTMCCLPILFAVAALAYYAVQAKNLFG